MALEEEIECCNSTHPWIHIMNVPTRKYHPLHLTPLGRKDNHLPFHRWAPPLQHRHRVLPMSVQRSWSLSSGFKCGALAHSRRCISPPHSPSTNIGRNDVGHRPSFAMTGLAISPSTTTSSTFPHPCTIEGNFDGLRST